MKQSDATPAEFLADLQAQLAKPIMPGSAPIPNSSAEPTNE